MCWGKSGPLGTALQQTRQRRTCCQKSWFPDAGFHYGFHDIAVFFHWQLGQLRNKPAEVLRKALLQFVKRPHAVMLVSLNLSWIADWGAL
jgi:hypothetical protein